MSGISGSKEMLDTLIWRAEAVNGCYNGEIKQGGILNKNKLNMKMNCNCTDRPKGYLIGTVALVLLIILSILCSTPGNVEAKPSQAVTQGNTCDNSGCHITNPVAGSAIHVSVDFGAELTGPITVNKNAGDSIDVDWFFTGIKGSGDDYVGVLIEVPTGWTVTDGSATAPPLAGWNTTWDGSILDETWDATVLTTTNHTCGPVVCDGHTILFNGNYSSGASSAACDNTGCKKGSDADGENDKMGIDATIAIPGGEASGDYEFRVYGVGHDNAGSSCKQQPQ
jgi:hypothetical protein